MFTGLIKEVGIIKKIEENEEGRLFEIYCPELIKDIGVDDSVATNGTCLTAVEVNNKTKTFKAQAVHTTLQKTTLALLKQESEVNLELAMLPTDRLGGHFVQGHVNTMATLKEIEHLGDNKNLIFSIEDEQMKFLIDEGSITIDGISLTVAKVINENNEFIVTIIPHTWDQTNLRNKAIGDKVNIEVDMMAKYLWNFQKYHFKK